jgi:hypothetical protein
MQTNALLAFGILTTVAVALLAFIASHKGHPIMAAFLAAAAWLFVGLNVLIWLWVRSYPPALRRIGSPTPLSAIILARSSS